jgi:hypothetical protein
VLQTSRKCPILFIPRYNEGESFSAPKDEVLKTHRSVKLQLHPIFNSALESRYLDFE